MQQPGTIAERNVADWLHRAGRALALAGVVLPLLLIGALKFTPTEIEALRPLIGATPWLAWLDPLLGAAGASHLLGIVEITSAVLLLVSLWWPRAALVGGALATFTFLVTCSLMLCLPILEPNSVQVPMLNAIGQFLIKDIALLGVSLVITAEAWAQVRADLRDGPKDVA